ncbi:helicase and polymerase-containing protein TEBICHI [Humulus lupulus]|uniref:helicase and polymerase-containing protein TEBICHI n=1 Tax=Humulus lupulus TaxID=3486 RepID=UPI002B4169DA|nr:helicase and polymerase-containing protein TEBICHI [Humulus lupulus]XP_062109141.1 helicase and polymerase-containing protein TEBICHI [Humulus lupulus]XP_062109142.1 helicase and polymerase-containing protein TEBICHI [Humulus lupulus]XP_062109143.1 helicase and polymerase-containing protein TEBICHI [Humulus lupulus]
MASGSPRSRIDQFFASKKRKSVSPCLKHERKEKIVKNLDGSPSAKGTLDSYLVTSQGDNNSDKPSYAGHDALAPQDSVKRNLSLEIDKSRKDDCKRLLSSFQSQAAEELEPNQKETSGELLEVVGVAVGHSGKGSSSDLVQGAENSELKKFKTDFLSLYCSDLQSNVDSHSELKVNDHKRQASPLLIDNSKKRHCITNQSHLECKTTCSDEKNSQDIHSTVCKTAVTTGNESNDLIPFQPTLKKCSNISNSSLDMIEVHTPGSLTAKICFRETPKSTRGSSIFSPGEAFWDEAIQLADGLCHPTVSFCAKAADEVGFAESRCYKKNSDNLIEKINEGVSIAPSTNLQGLLGRHGNELEEKSHFPVKHFDFLFDDKNLDGSTVRHDVKISHGGGVSSESASVPIDHSCPKNDNNLNHHNTCERNKEICGEQEMTPVVAVAKKGNLLGRDDESMKCGSPIDGIKKSISNSECGEGTPSSVMPSRDWLDLNSWLPSEICSVYRRKGISKLYQWQVDCLQVEGVLQRRNLVYCASTSAGKSFVAEILMLRRVLSFGKMALLVLPYVSICAEKAEHLEVLLEPLGKHVRSYYGNQGGGTLPKDTSVAVCTIEKANSLINRLLEEGRLSELGIIVIDELHMVGDRSRGYLLELMLTKLRYAAGEGNSEGSSGESSGTSSGKHDPAHGLQIVGMSATMPNVGAVADWLQAALYQTDFRPVPLEEYIKVGNTIYNKNMDIVRTISKAADLGGKDPDHVVELCNEVVQEGHSVLIFCSSRKGCESTARHISKFLRSFMVSSQNNDAEYADITSAIDALRRCPVGLDPVLEETLPFGIAYHHAGLTVEEREVVETCYRKGLIRVLTATSTLAAGVNLPARRVIFRQPKIGRDFIDGTRYRQMSGRAGRTGIDTKGESVLICKPEEIKRISGLLNESCPPLHSCLSEDMNGMIHAILEVVAGGIVQTAKDIHRYVRCTLLNSTKPFQDVVKSAQESLRWLCHRKFLEWNEDTKLYSTTPLGRASFGSSLSPEESLIVLDDLSRAREGFVLASDLHLVYLVTPINVDVEPNWELYYERFMELSALDQSVGYRVGVAEPFLMRMAHGAPIRTSKLKENMSGLRSKCQNQLGITNNTSLSDDQALRVCKRFYVSLILSRLVQEAPVPEVCDTFKVARGMVQALQENAGRFASMVSVFCERLGWQDLEGLVGKFQNRVSFGVRAEIVELTTIPYVKGSRARALYKAGMRTPLSIAEASIAEIVKALFETSSWAAEERSAQRRIQLGVAKKIKNGARKMVLEKAEEARIAAFAAFKSLGLNVPHFPGPSTAVGNSPSLSTAVGNSCEQGGATSSGNDTGNSADNVEHMEHATKPSVEDIVQSDKVLSVSEEKTTKTSDTSVVAFEVNSNAVMPWKFGADESIVLTEHPDKVLSVSEEKTTKTSDTSVVAFEVNSNAVMPRKFGADESIVLTEHPDKVLSVSEEKTTKTSDTSVVAFEVNSNAVMPRKFRADESIVLTEHPVTLQTELEATVSHSKDANLTHLIKPQEQGGRNMIGNEAIDPQPGERQSNIHLTGGFRVSANEKGPMHATNVPGGFDSFLDIWENASEFYFDVHYNKRSEVNSVASFEVHGIAICWDNSSVYYVNLPKDLQWSDKSINDSVHMNASGDKNNMFPAGHWLEIVRHRWERISRIMGKKDVRKYAWNLKVQIQALKCPAVSVQKFGSQKPEELNRGFEIIDSSFVLLTPICVNYGIDMCIVAWILWPDEERSSNPNLEKEVKKRLSSEAATAANQNGRWRNQMRRAAHNGCCRRVAQTRALCSVLWKLIVSDELTEALLNVEIPLVNILADMELCGIGVDMEGCLQARNLLGKKLRNLEKEAYKLAGMTFSLYTAADIANVLYGHLKLPIPETGNKGKHHPSTDKHCLDLLRHEHPIIPVIKEHRTLAKLLNCTLGSICSLAKLSAGTHKHTLHGHWLQTSTATGRLSMEEPNLQNVEHMVGFQINKDKKGKEADADCYEINARDYFVPTQDNWLLLTADYSQIELRLMAHFSKDSALVELLSKPSGDVFTLIASRWTGCSEDSVGSDERDQTKRLVYGILYGMGANTLAEQLGCSPAEAGEKIRSFKSSFPGVASWLHEVVADCREKGYVKTIKGRKRFLSKIKFGNAKEKSKAERQAVNSICQGSAADIIKIAMINIYSVIADGVVPASLSSHADKFSILKGCCRILLQVHDELVLEADPSVIKEAASLLQMSMENATSLLVPLHVKLKLGRKWGSMEPFQEDKL